MINNAAFTTKNKKNYIGSLNNQSYKIFKDTLDINLVAPFYLTKKLAFILKKTQNPSVINISSIYSLIAPDFKIYKNTNMGNSAAYTSSKGGLNQLTLWLSSALSPKIRVNSISPGGISRNQPSIFSKKYISKCLLGRMASEKDIVGPVIFLASDLSSYISGHNLVVDGGYTKT